jgi:23S rRNA (cytosine1962-C5)-methyltransferase
MNKIKIKKSFKPKQGYLWIFSNEVDGKLSEYTHGELVEIYLHNDKFYGIGYVNPNTLIAVRIISFSKKEINKEFIKATLKRAINYRKNIGFLYKEACRIFYSESDGLPGLIIDKYKNYLSVQTLTAGIEKLYPIIREVLIELFNPKAIILKNDSNFRTYEGLEQYVNVDYGKYENMQIISEEGVKYFVDLISGQKTGFFLDQRINRLLLRDVLKNRNYSRLLDCFSYSGGWALSASCTFTGEIICVDSSEKAIQLIKKNAELNHREVKTVRKDVFDFLKECHINKETFDCIILDPPAFIKSKSKIKEGFKGYKEINQRAMRILNRGGLLVTSSCSHHMYKDMFFKMLRSCSKDTKRNFRILYTGTQSPDHPILLNMPETEYLKTVFLENID